MARPRGDIQPRIVTAARAAFLARGVDGASLREIARAARTNIGMVVYYFPSKDDLFLAVVEETYAGLVSEMAAILEADGPARERLRRTFVRLGNASPQELDVIRLVIREALSSSTRLHRILARFMRGHIPLLVATVADGLRDGEFDPTIPAPFVLLAAMGLGGLPQLARHALKAVPMFASLPDPEALADRSITLISRAVGPAPAAEPGRAKRTRARRDRG